MAAMDGDGIVGCADGMKAGKIKGWAWRPKAPEDHVAGQVLVLGFFLTRPKRKQYIAAACVISIYGALYYTG